MDASKSHASRRLSVSCKIAAGRDLIGIQSIHSPTDCHNCFDSNLKSFLDFGVPCETAPSQKKSPFAKSRKKWPRPEVETATIVNFFSTIFQNISLEPVTSRICKAAQYQGDGKTGLVTQIVNFYQMVTRKSCGRRRIVTPVTT